MHEPVRLLDVQVIPGDFGSLGVLEASKHMGFEARRVYFLTDLPEGARRGAHAHKTLKQCFVCLRGSVTLEITKGDFRSVLELNDYRRAAVLESGCWLDLRSFSKDALVLVLASREYDESDYIRDFSEFRLWEQGRAADPAVPYLDLKRTDEEIGLELRQSIDSVLSSGWYIGGPAVAEFERSFASYCGAAEAVGVANGLQALFLVLRAWGIGPGDEVLVPAHTFIATALAVTEVGATPVLVDVEEDTGLLDVSLVAALVGPRTKAIIPVHLYGHPVDLDPLVELARRRNLLVLEDAAQAHGARYKGRRCGSIGDAAAFSFYPTKNLGAVGDAGAVVTHDAALAAKVRQLGNYGASRKYLYAVEGTNSRLDPIQAAVLSAKLRHLDDWNGRRSEHAARYLAGLSDIAGLQLPATRAWADPVWHVFPIRVADGRRDALDEALLARGIGTNIHYPVPVHLQPCYAGRWEEGQFPIAEKLSKTLLSLPLNPTHTPGEIDRVIEIVRELLR